MIWHRLRFIDRLLFGNYSCVYMDISKLFGRDDVNFCNFNICSTFMDCSLIKSFIDFSRVVWILRLRNSICYSIVWYPLNFSRLKNHDKLMIKIHDNKLQSNLFRTLKGDKSMLIKRELQTSEKCIDMHRKISKNFMNWFSSWSIQND